MGIYTIDFSQVDEHVLLFIRHQDKKWWRAVFSISTWCNINYIQHQYSYEHPFAVAEACGQADLIQPHPMFLQS